MFIIIKIIMNDQLIEDENDKKHISIGEKDNEESRHSNISQIKDNADGLINLVSIEHSHIKQFKLKEKNPDQNGNSKEGIIKKANNQSRINEEKQ